ILLILFPFFSISNVYSGSTITINGFEMISGTVKLFSTEIKPVKIKAEPILWINLILLLIGILVNSLSRISFQTLNFFNSVLGIVCLIILKHKLEFQYSILSNEWTTIECKFSFWLLLIDCCIICLLSLTKKPIEKNKNDSKPSIHINIYTQTERIINKE
uniref:hypothetical protein n=1 Tax=Flavobacterium filum TaxID=370974 RepID=UPI0023F14806